jgi:hypothetical protein
MGVKRLVDSHRGHRTGWNVVFDNFIFRYDIDHGAAVSKGGGQRGTAHFSGNLNRRDGLEA